MANVDFFRFISFAPGIPQGQRTKSCINDSFDMGAHEVVQESPQQAAPSSESDFARNSLFVKPTALANTGSYVLVFCTA